MNYLRFGSSKKYLVFLHGWGADKNSFLWTKDYFSDYCLIFVDFPGFGDSPEPAEPYSVFDYVCKLKDLLDEFEIESLTLIAHSFGGRVAIKFAFLFQNEYEKFKLCLVDAAGIKPRRNIKYFFKVYKYKLHRRLFPNSKKLSKYGSKDFVLLSPVMKQTFIRVVNEDLSSYAKFIKADTLIIWGDRDTETKPYMARKLNKLIANSKLNFIEGAGHFSFLDNPQEFVILLDTFLKNS